MERLERFPSHSVVNSRPRKRFRSATPAPVRELLVVEGAIVQHHHRDWKRRLEGERGCSIGREPKDCAKSASPKQRTGAEKRCHHCPSKVPGVMFTIAHRNRGDKEAAGTVQHGSSSWTSRNRRLVDPEPAPTALLLEQMKQDLRLMVCRATSSASTTATRKEPIH